MAADSVLHIIDARHESHARALVYCTSPTGALEILNYKQVVTQARLSARKLLHAAGSHARVGVAMDTGTALPILELAILMAGQVLVPLNVRDEPAARLAGMLADAGLSLVVVQADLAAPLSKACELVSTKFCPAIMGWTTLEQQAPDNGSTARQPLPGVLQSSDNDTLSHIFFTSGSSGRPKGCLGTFRALNSYCCSKNAAHKITSDSVCLVASTPTFDPHLLDILATWAAGGVVAMAAPATNFAHLGMVLSRTQATHICCTPTLFRTLSSASLTTAGLSLQYVALGGEAMPPDLCRQWSQCSFTLANTYGLTEACGYQMLAEVKPPLSGRFLGRPLGANVALLVCLESNDPDEQVPEGSDGIGEIWLAGPQVGLGYLGFPELTRQRFIEHARWGRCVRTGDLARATAQGWKLLGRMDFMVKLNGQRIELEEIEHVLVTAGAGLLAAVAVTVLEQTKQLVAWCVLHKDFADATKDGSLYEKVLRQLCKNLLPRHMVPGRFGFCDDLAVTTSGKLDRKALALLPLPAADWSRDTGEPMTGLMVYVADVWAQVLGTKPHGPAANFLAYGGDSMAALRVCRQLFQGQPEVAGVFGEGMKELSPAELLQRPVLQDFVAHIQTCQSTEAPGQLVRSMGPELHRSKPTGDDLLLLAVQAKNEAMLAFVLANGTILGINAVSAPRARGPLHAACAAGSTELARQLLAHGAPLLVTDDHGVQPIHLACMGGPMALIDLLLATSLARRRTSGSLLAARDHDQQTPLHYACRSGCSVRVATELLARQAVSVDCRDRWQRTPLHWAVDNGHRDLVKALVAAGADAQATDLLGETPLAIAERRARCGAGDRPGELRPSRYGDIAGLLGGSGATKHLQKKKA